MELVPTMYKAHPYFSLKNLGKKVHIIHSKIWYLVFIPVSDSELLKPLQCFK